jgi:fatty-acid peroxygenase
MSALIDAVVPILLRDGYRSISRRCDELGSDIIETRFLLRPTVCIRGEEAARLFYEPGLFVRHGAVPRRVRKTLLGQGGVHGLDGEAHERRKRLFMELMESAALERLRAIATEEWERRIARWERAPGRHVLFREAQEVLCRTSCRWAGVPLPEAWARRRARQLAAMVDSFGAVGPRLWRGRAARLATERWARALIRRARRGRIAAPEGTALAVIARHRDARGRLLDTRTAAVELLNVLRPTVAVAYFVAFAAHALHLYPGYQLGLQNGDEGELERFVQEVRRFYPFAPAVGARAVRDLRWQGHRIPRGRLVILDLYGTDHDARSWERPDEFMPERFLSWNGSAFNFVPNGGGDFFLGHRCAGEWMTLELLKVAVRVLAREIEYEVPPQNLAIPLTRIPTFPVSGFVLARVRRRRVPYEAENPVRPAA